MDDMKLIVGTANSIYESIDYLKTDFCKEKLVIVDDISSTVNSLVNWAGSNGWMFSCDTKLNEELVVNTNRLLERGSLMEAEKYTATLEKWINTFICGTYQDTIHKNDVIVLNTDNGAAPSEGRNLYESRENVYCASIPPNGPLVTVIIQAYNRLDKTRVCVESFLQHSTDIDNRLVLIDNGSTDDTLEYFKNVRHPNKTILHVTKNIGMAVRVSDAVAINTKYSCSIPNDIILTPRALSNMINCMESDPTIGMAVACSSNVSNFQNPGFTFSSGEELMKIAERNNISNPKKWHERIRLITLLTISRVYAGKVAGSDSGFFHDFADDAAAFAYRRAGYKTVVCFDTYVHHNHDVFGGEGKDPVKFQKSLNSGRENFKKKFYGIDAWDDVNNFDFYLISLLKLDDLRETAPNILGIEVRCGTPILEIKNKLKEYDVFFPVLAAFTSKAKYYIDLSTICGANVYCDRLEYMHEYIQDSSMDIIVVSDMLYLVYNSGEFLKYLIRFLKPGGQLLIKVLDTGPMERILTKLRDDNDIQSRLLNLDILDKVLKENKAGIVNRVTVEQKNDESFERFLKVIIKKYENKGYRWNEKTMPSLILHALCITKEGE